MINTDKKIIDLGHKKSKLPLSNLDFFISILKTRKITFSLFLIISHSFLKK